MKIGNLGAIVKGAIERVGRHPLMIGIVAITGLIGFVLSIYAYQEDRASSIEDTKQMERNIEAITGVGEDVRAISEATYASCARAPCWELKDLVSRDTIGKPKDLIDAKVAPATRKENGQFLYEIDGCVVRIEYTDDAVSYFSANLFKYVELEGQTDEYRQPIRARRSCNFSVARLFNVDDGSLADNANLTVADAMRIVEPSADCNGCMAPELRISNTCIDCGNYANPYIEFMQHGSHAEMFINSFFKTSFDPVDDTSEEGFNIYTNFRETMRGYIGEGAKYGIEVEPLCERNIYPDVKNILARSQITAVGLGVGPRAWTSVLFCDR